jgi:hypothetical protein
MLDKQSKTVIASGAPHELRESADPAVWRFFNRQAAEGRQT